MNYKQLSIILIIALVLVSGFSAALWLKPNWFKTGEQTALVPAGSNSNATNANSNTAPTNANMPETFSGRFGPQPTSDEVTKGYLSSKFRILGVVSNGPDKNGYTDISKLINQVNVVVAVARKQDDNQNDSQCGSIYSQPVCYFFIEPLYIAGAPPAKFLAELDTPGSLNVASIKFVDPDSIEFTTADGDAGYGFVAKWRLNLNTGKITQLSKTETTH